MIDLHLKVRPADRVDYQALSSLLYFETHVHRHLDWRMPLDWLGEPFFWVLEDERRLVGTLACPADPPGVAWIRLFAHSGNIAPGWAWPTLWEAARREISARGGAAVAAIIRQEWFQHLLIQSGFKHAYSIVMLEWQGRPILPPTSNDRYRLRTITKNDLPSVTEVDAEAFGSFWHNSLDTLERALAIAAYATVLEVDGRIMAYQLSTGNAAGAHLARLAVRKEAQGQGLGRALVSDLLHQMRRRNVDIITVNTQADNAASLSLYQKLGFVRTGEEFPVYRFDVEDSRR